MLSAKNKMEVIPNFGTGVIVILLYTMRGSTADRYEARAQEKPPTRNGASSWVGYEPLVVCKPWFWGDGGLKDVKAGNKPCTGTFGVSPGRVVQARIHKDIALALSFLRGSVVSIVEVKNLVVPTIFS